MSTPMAPGALHAGLHRRLFAAAAKHREAPMQAEDRNYLNKRLIGLVVLARVIISLAGLFLALTAAQMGAQVPTPAIGAMLIVVAALSWTGLARMRSRAPVTQAELMLQVAADAALLTLALTFAGRNESPFDYLFLLPLLFGACALGPWRMAIVAGMVAAGWALTEHLHHAGSADAVAFEIASHLVVGALVVYFAHAVSTLSRMHERVLSGRRERVITALGAEAKGMLATRAAHTLSTPLGTMAVIVADLRQDRIADAERQGALETLASQIAICKLHLSGMLQSAGVDRGEGGYRANAVQLLNEMREECLLYYPAGQVTLEPPRVRAGCPEVVIELSLFNALAGLAKDLAREPPHAAHLSASWDAAQVAIRVAAPRPSEGAPSNGAPAPRPPGSRRLERLAVLSAIAGRHGGEVLLEQDGGCVVVRLPHADPRAAQVEQG